MYVPSFFFHNACAEGKGDEEVETAQLREPRAELSGVIAGWAIGVTVWHQ